MAPTPLCSPQPPARSRCQPFLDGRSVRYVQYIRKAFQRAFHAVIGEQAPSTEKRFGGIWETVSPLGLQPNRDQAQSVSHSGWLTKPNLVFVALADVMQRRRFFDCCPNPQRGPDGGQQVRGCGLGYWQSETLANLGDGYGDGDGDGGGDGDGDVPPPLSPSCSAVVEGVRVVVSNGVVVGE